MTTPTQLDRIEAEQRAQGLKLDAILALVTAQTLKGTTMSQQLDNLTAQVQATTDTEQSAITLITGLADEIRRLRDDPAALDALHDRLKASADALAAAIVANTPTTSQPAA